MRLTVCAGRDPGEPFTIPHTGDAPLLPGLGLLAAASCSS
jgi:hypothetical protein